MRPKTPHCLLGLAALLPMAAHAGIFLCRGDDGSLLTTDHLSAECLAHGGKEMNADGSVRRVIRAAGAGAAGAGAAAGATGATDVAAVPLQRQREDRALLVRYPDQASFDAAERSDLNGPRSLIESASSQLAALLAQRRGLAQDEQFYVHHTQPPDLRGRIETNRVLTQQQRQLIAAQQAEAARIRARYAQLHTRLAALWKRGVAP